MSSRVVAGTTALALGCVTVLAAAAPVAAAEPDPDGRRSHEPHGSHGSHGSRVRLLGAQVIPKGTTVEGVEVGELSGIDYDPWSGRWFLIPDDTEYGPARFLTADLELDARGLHNVEFTDSRSILRSDGSEFPSWSTDDPEVADPESIRWDWRTGSFWWSSEGKRDPESGHALVQPWVRQMTPAGSYVRELRQPDEFRVDEPDFGPQPNGAFEGLSLSWTGRHLVTTMESPLYQDGADGTVNRITFYHKWSGKPVRQFGYRMDDLEGNGITEILAESPHRYLVVERNYVDGEGNSIRVYRIDLRGATDVLGTESLADGDFRPVRKELLVDFADLEAEGLEHVDNIEAVSWGPRLRTGERSLVFVSDDNFNDTQISQVVALAVGR